MNVGESFLSRELRQTSPTRRAKPSYKSRACSINCSSSFPGPSSERWSRKTRRNGAPKGLAAGRSWCRCCSANSPTPIPCARFATVWAVAWASWFISVSPRPPTNPPFPMPTSTGPPSCTRICSSPRSPGSATKKDWGSEVEVPFQEQAALPRLDHHFAVPGTVSVGQVPTGQRRRQGSRSARPRRLPAQLRPDHRSQTQ